MPQIENYISSKKKKKKKTYRISIEVLYEYSCDKEKMKILLVNTHNKISRKSLEIYFLYCIILAYNVRRLWFVDVEVKSPNKTKTFFFLTD